MFYVYVYYSGNEPFYVGKGKNGRWKEHLSRPEFRSRKDVTARIEFFDKEDDALAVEAHLISLWGERLVNIAQPQRRELIGADDILARFMQGAEPPPPISKPEVLLSRVHEVAGQLRFLVNSRTQELCPAQYDEMTFLRSLLRDILRECILDQKLLSEEYSEALRLLSFAGYHLEGIKEEVLEYPKTWERHFSASYTHYHLPKWPQKFI